MDRLSTRLQMCTFPQLRCFVILLPAFCFRDEVGCYIEQRVEPGQKMSGRNNNREMEEGRKSGIGIEC
jgi:hypothetical protein